MTEEQPVSFRMHKDVIKAVDDVAKIQNLNRSEFIRASIDRELKRLRREVVQRE